MTPDQVVQLRYALTQFAGMTITPALAEAIERAARYVPDNSIDPKRFPPLESNGYHLQAERFSDILPELHPMHERHWLETEKHRHGFTLDPDYDRVRAAEREGRLVQFTIRHAGELVGNLRMYLSVSIHSRTLIAEEDTLYIAPEHRSGGFLPVRFMRYAERCLLDLGVREIRANSKLMNSADVLMRRLGYKAVAIQFVRIFGAEASEGKPDVL